MAIIERRRELLGEQGPEPGRGLENYTWEEISYISKTGNPSAYGISVGDTKTITLNGTIGGTSGGRQYNNQAASLKIIGINHDSIREGNGITFQLFSVGTKQNAVIVDYRYGYSGGNIVMNEGSSYATHSNVGGWASCYMRSTYLPQFKALLPSELQSVIKTTIKYSDNTGGGSDIASYVTATTDECFLLSEYEIFGTRTEANSTEQNYQAQYTFYANGGSTIKYKDSAMGGSAVEWWERSVAIWDSKQWCFVSQEGTADGGYAGIGRTIAPAFRV